MFLDMNYDPTDINVIIYFLVLGLNKQRVFNKFNSSLTFTPISPIPSEMVKLQCDII